MRLNLRYGLLIFFFFFFAATTFGQDEHKSIELRKILDEISLKHNVKFSYLENDVAGRSIFPPREHMPLRATLIYISNRTGLSFKQTGDYIILFRNNREVIPGKVCAYIVDELGLPVEKASIQYGGKKILVTESDGYFELPKEQASQIYIDHLGYRPVLLTLNDFDNDCKKITLYLEIQQLEELITERYLATGISKSKEGVFIIKPKKFGILPGLIEPDVLQTMQQLPGINSIDETVSNINVRGGTHDQNLFSWNGIRLFQTGHFFGLISALNPNIAHDITIAKNGTSAFYGESVSSTVDISSRRSMQDTTFTSIGSNMINAEFYTKVKTSENAGFELSARRSFTDVLDFPTYSKYSDRIFQNTVVTELNSSNDVNYKSDKEFYFYDFTGQYHQKITAKHEIFLDVIGIKNKLDFTQGTVNITDVITTQSNLNQFTLGGSVGWKSQWNEYNTTEINVYSSSYKVDGKNESIESNQVVTQLNTIADTGVRLMHTNNYSTAINLYAGYQYNTISLKNEDRVTMPDITRNSKTVLNTHALIGEAEYISESQKLYTRGGLRLNYIEQLNRLYAEPRLLANYALTNNWKAEVLAEIKSQSASQVVELQEDFLGIEKRRWILADDEDIPLQQSKQVSAGITYKNKGWLVSADNFFKKVKGITTYGQAFQDQLETVQASGEYKIYGTEFLVQKQFNHFYAWLSYTWNNNNYSFKGVTPTTFSSSFEIAHTINTAAIYEWKNLKLALGSKWYTGRPYTPPLLNTPVYDGAGTPSIAYEYPNTNNIGNFFQANFSASYQWKFRQGVNLQLGISILNIFNRRNIINRYYRINSNDDIEVVNTYSIARTPNALIKVSF